MPNAAERLFDSVLRNLGPGQVLDWPRAADTVGEDDPVDEPRDSQDDSVFSADQYYGRLLKVDDLIGGVGSEAPLDDVDEEVIEGGIRQRGFDALAFYKSRRMMSARPFPGRWGIFYLKQGLVYIESQIMREYPGYGDTRKLALDFLRQHERFHYRADLQTLLFEATRGQHLYEPLRHALRARRSHFIEEALANRQVWDWSQKASVGIEEFAFEFMKLQPNAYARFDEPPLQLAAEWAGTVVNQMPPGVVLRPDLAHWVEASPRALLRPSLCPEYVICPAHLSTWLDPALVLPPVTNVEDGEKVAKTLAGRFQHLRKQWEATKKKLLENRFLRGLNFKPWPKGGANLYSVRVDDNFRAHLEYLGEGRWIANDLGPHNELGHG